VIAHPAVAKWFGDFFRARHFHVRDVAKLVVSLVFGAVMHIDRRITVNVSPVLLTPNSENYVGPVTVKSVVVFFVAAAAMFALLSAAVRFASRRNDWLFGKTQGPLKGRWLWVYTAVMGLCWSPWLLSNLPGGVFPDTYWVYDMIAGRIPLTNHQPILYTGLNALVFYVVQSIFRGSSEMSVLAMTVLQFTFMAACLAQFLCWLRRRGISPVVAHVVLAFFALFPMFSYYASSNWKDTWFSICIFMLSVFLVDVVRTKATNLLTSPGIVQYCLMSFAVAWFRNNGVYVVGVVTVVVLVVYRRTLFGAPARQRSVSAEAASGCESPRRRGATFVVWSMTLLVVTGVVQGPVFSRLGWSPDQALESQSIPIQQICSVIANGGAVTDAQHAVFDQVVKPAIVQVYFSPNGVDPVKQYLDPAARAYLAAHQVLFLKTWAGVVIHNPRQAADAYLLTTLGFWDPTRGTQDGYIMRGLAPGGKWYGLTSRDLILEYTGVPFGDAFAPRHYMSAALFGWIALCCLTVVVARRRGALIVPFVPMMALWATVMLTTPLAFSFRYVFALVPFVPLAIILMLASERWVPDLGGGAAPVEDSASTAAAVGDTADKPTEPPPADFASQSSEPEPRLG